MDKENLKELLDILVKKYETSLFICDDPVKFPHLFNNLQDQEISGLISSSLAYGKREKIIKDVEKIHQIMDFQPYKFVKNFDYKKDYKLFDDFIHRYTLGKDIALLILALNTVLKEYESLKNIFLEGFSPDDINIRQGLTHFVHKIRKYLPVNEDLKGVHYLIPDPDKGSACKRLNLFLRWMARSGPVDLNIWKKIPASKLIIPLDVHVAKLSKKLQLTNRKVNDWKTAEEITAYLKQFDPYDPVKYDFALFGMGISGEVS